MLTCLIKQPCITRLTTKYVSRKDSVDDVQPGYIKWMNKNNEIFVLFCRQTNCYLKTSKECWSKLFTTCQPPDKSSYFQQHSQLQSKNLRWGEWDESEVMSWATFMCCLISLMQASNDIPTHNKCFYNKIFDDISC